MVYGFEVNAKLTVEEQADLRAQAESAETFFEMQANVGWADWMYHFCNIDEGATDAELDEYKPTDAELDDINDVLRLFFDEAEKKRLEAFEEKYN